MHSLHILSLLFRALLSTMHNSQVEPKVASKSLSSVSRSSADLRSPLSNPMTSLRETVRVRRGAQSSIARATILLISDISCIMVSWVWWIIRDNSIQIADSWSSVAAVSSSLPALAIIIGIMMSRGLYKAGLQWQNFLASFKAVALGVVISGLVLLTYQPIQLSARLTALQIGQFGISSLLMVLGSRAVFAFLLRFVRAKGAVRHSVCLICDENEQAQALQTLESQRHYSVKHVIEASALDLGNRAEMLKTLESMNIDEVFVSWDAIYRRLFLCWHFQKAGITLQILPTSLDPLFWQPEVWMMGGIPTLKFSPSILMGFSFGVKRCADFLASLLVLLVLSPVYIFISLSIKFDSPGPIFYRQTRVGLHGKHFKVWKFRSMVTNADKLQKELEAKNETNDGILFKMKDDPRITRVGKFLRQYSLDELPQLLNVLVGEMSLVGPRPLPIRDVEKFSQHHFIRHEVLPGITGFWQVSGRSDIMDFEQVMKMDLMYIENWSLWLDLKILFKTVEVILKKTGAY